MRKYAYIGIREAANRLNANLRQFTAFLVDEGYCYRSDRAQHPLCPEKDQVLLGHMVIWRVRKQNYTGQQMRFTPAGFEYISQRWADYNPPSCDMRKTARKRFLAEKSGNPQKEKLENNVIRLFKAR